jgi:hypothetical protein
VSRVVAFVLVAISATTGFTTPAGASSAGTGKFGGAPPVLGVGLLVSTPGAGGGHETFGAGDPHAPRPVFTRAIPAAGGTGAGGLAYLCQIGPMDPTQPLGNGWIFSIELFATSNGADLGTIRTICEPFAPGAPGLQPAPPALPQPPTIGEIWRAAGLPTPPIGVSPPANGITGLPTWVWTAGSAAVAVAVNLGGYRVAGRARIVGYGVFPGEDGWVRSRVAGKAGDPAFAHTYETVGTYRLGVATLWSADAVMTGPGLANPLTIALGTAVVTNARDYPVTQIRSRLIP